MHLHMPWTRTRDQTVARTTTLFDLIFGHPAGFFRILLNFFVSPPIFNSADIVFGTFEFGGVEQAKKNYFFGVRLAVQ
jgi:hypothetical protein